ncbi:bifunctional folylpolyglutamate synthase/dihydrofolate synthase [Fredinandcohnia sp. 179-A 10B2 NHS]|uniref:bifunctional folylpolyglutamate synthase/dihydrofolate synthase n=1 Tax=Fredinandcohnia sp. 179-A 10B2 NHS TaxID=3235176 RepID=UPI0039A1A460
MIHTYEDALSWIHSRLRLGIKPGLSRMEWMMERLNHPEKKIKAIHVGGTNGKGSTVSYLRNILQQAGYSVGTFTSPYIESFNERISLNGKPIRDEEIVSLLQVIKPLADELEQTDLGGPTEFEVITAMALYYFGTNPEIDFVIMEVGLGGRFDSTNVITPMLSIITSIGYDHMNILGDTLTEIASEKAGIIKEGKPVITAVDQEEAIQVISQKAKQTNSALYQLSKDFFIVDHKPSEQGELFSLKTPNDTYKNLFLSMKGAHQVNNASLAVMAIKLLVLEGVAKISEKELLKGLEETNWVGRFEQISTQPPIIIDGAHNPEGIKSLVDTIKTHLSDKKVHVVFSALKDKKLDNMISQLEEVADSLTFTSFDFPRAASSKDLYESSSASDSIRVIENWIEAIEISKNKLSNSENEVLLITGSLYFISNVRHYILSTKN